MRSHFSFHRVVAIAAMLCLGSTPLVGQTKDQEMRSQSLSLSPGDQLIEMNASLPAEVMVGETFKYVIEISNASENIALRDIKIEQTKNEGVAVESVEMKQQGDQHAKSHSSGDEKTRSQAAGQGTWTIDHLEPGQSRTFEITATSEKEGQLKTCLAVTSYTPTLCLTTKSVKPDLEIVKRAPEKSSLCDVVEWEYYIKNVGSGDPGTFVVRDELPEGIETINGDKRLEFKVDGIVPGDARKFVAKLRARQPGDYRSAAVAAWESGKQSKSNKAGTKIVEAELAVSIEGPQTRYVNRLADYAVIVTNHGEAVAENAQLSLRFPGELQVARVTEPQASDKQAPRPEGHQSKAKSSAGDAKKAEESRDPSKDSQQHSSAKSSKQVLKPSETRSWELGTLKPGESIKVDFTVRGDQQGEAHLAAEASFECSVAKGAVKSSATTQTQFIALPALMIAVVDKKDPVPTNGTVEYTIVVGNEGDAPDQDIRVTVQLPEELEFVDATGETKGKSQGRQVTFEPVKQLEPGQKVRWDVTTKATKKGDVRVQVELESKHLTGITKAEEPTVLFAADEATSN